MKKSIFLLSLFFIALFVACDEDKEASPLSIDLSKSATVKGYVYAELDLTSAGIEVVPEGTKLIVSVPHNQLSSSSNGVWRDTVAVGANGMFEATVPTDDNGATVTITPIPFETDQVQEYGSFDATVKMIYQTGTTSVAVSPNDIKFVQISYSTTSLNNYVEFVNVSGTAEAELNDTVVGKEAVPQGTTIILYNSSFQTSITVGAEGAYSVNVPSNMNINYEISFEANRWVGDTLLPYLFEKDTYFGNFPANTEDKTIDVGFGDLIED